MPSQECKNCLNRFWWHQSCTGEHFRCGFMSYFWRSSKGSLSGSDKSALLVSEDLFGSQGRPSEITNTRNDSGASSEFLKTRGSVALSCIGPYPVSMAAGLAGCLGGNRHSPWFHHPRRHLSFTWCYESSNVCPVLLRP